MPLTLAQGFESLTFRQIEYTDGVLMLTRRVVVWSDKTIFGRAQITLKSGFDSRTLECGIDTKTPFYTCDGSSVGRASDF